jgi:hypothetical protein
LTPPGGRIGEPGFLNGIFEGKVYGVRSAIRVCAERGLLIRLTLDKIQSWFRFKPTREEQPKPRTVVPTVRE